MGIGRFLWKKENEAERELKGKSLYDCSYVVVDTELTGLDFKRDSIVSIGAVQMQGRRIFIGGPYYQEVRPDSDMRHESVVIHGITPAEVTDKPPIDDIIDRFMEFCGNSVVVGHFVTIEISFINKVLKKLGRESFGTLALDTFKIHEWISQFGVGSNSLSKPAGGDSDLFAVARYYRIPVTEGHNALMDAFMTAQLFQRFIDILRDLGVRTLREALNIGKP